MKLYELTKSYNELRSLLQETEQDSDIYPTLDLIEEKIEQKAENIAILAEEMKGDISTLEEEIRRLQAKKRRLERNRRSMIEYLKDNLERQGVDRIDTPKFSISLQNNPKRVEVVDESAIPKEFFKEQEPKLDKIILKKHMLETGEIVPGARIVQEKGVRIR